jgi:hypothetical protein
MAMVFGLFWLLALQIKWLCWIGVTRALTIALLITTARGWALSRIFRNVKDYDQGAARRNMFLSRQATRASKRIGRNDNANNARKGRRRQKGARAKTVKWPSLAQWRQSAVLITVGITIVVLTFAHINWDPYNAISVGQAAVPGPDHAKGTPMDAALMGITTRNVHGIMSNLMGTLRSGTDVICVQ